MRLPVRPLLAAALFCVDGYGATSEAAAPHAWHISGEEPGAWPAILSSIGLPPATGGPVKVAVVRNGPAASAQLWLPKIESGMIVTLEGDSELARAVGFLPTAKRILVRGVIDERRPKLPIYWEQPLELSVLKFPKMLRYSRGSGGTRRR